MITEQEAVDLLRGETIKEWKLTNHAKDGTITVWTRFGNGELFLRFDHVPEDLLELLRL